MLSLLLKKEVFSMKKIIMAALLAVIVVISSLGSAHSVNAVETKKSLKDMTAEECYETLCEMGLEFHEGWDKSSEKEKAEFTKEYVDFIIDNEAEFIPGIINYIPNMVMMVRIYPLVVEYEGLDNYANDKLSTEGTFENYEDYKEFIEKLAS